MKKWYVSELMVFDYKEFFGSIRNDRAIVSFEVVDEVSEYSYDELAIEIMISDDKTQYEICEMFEEMGFEDFNVIQIKL